MNVPDALQQGLTVFSRGAFLRSKLARPLASRFTPQMACLALVGFALASCAAAFGQTDYAWNKPAGGVFGQADSWSPPGPPGPNDRAIFNLPAGYDVIFDADYSNDRFLVDGGEVAFRLAGHTYSLANQVRVATSGNSARLTIEDPGSGGTVSVDRTMVVGHSGGIGTLNVFGSDSRLVVNGRGTDSDDPVNNNDVGFELGRQDGWGTLHIADGGYVSNQYTTTVGARGDVAIGEVTVDGPGSLLENHYQLEVGRDAYGSVYIQNGGSVTVLGDNPDPALGGAKGIMIIGMRTAGDVTVAGAGSSLTTAGQIQIGSAFQQETHPDDHGNGTLVVAAGAQVTSYKGGSQTTAGILGVFAEGEGYAMVIDPGSKWSLPDGDLAVGWLGFGDLWVANGGVVESDGGVLGRIEGGYGEATVTGEGSRWEVAGNLGLGGRTDVAGGSGDLYVEDNGVVTVGNELKVRGGSSVQLAGGSVVVGDGPIPPPNHLAVREGGTLSGSGTVLATEVGNLGGTVAPGDSPGTLSIDGRYIQHPAGSLNIELGGPNPGDYDLLEAMGDASLNGLLEVGLIGGFVPENAHSFEILTADGLSGFFSNAPPASPYLFSDGRFDVTYGANSVTLSNYLPPNDCSWREPVSGTFGDPARWTPVGPPELPDRAIFSFPVAAEYTVSFDSDFVNQRLLVDGSTVVFDLRGHTYTLEHEWDGISAVIVGDVAGLYSWLTVADGTVSSKDCVIGWSEGSEADLSVSTGGRFTAAGHFMTVGSCGIGGLLIEGGGRVEVGHSAVGEQETGVGTVTVDGSGSVWELTDGDRDSLIIGALGEGSVAVINGGAIHNSGGLAVGHSNYGEVAIDTGAEVTTHGGCHIGYLTGSVGYVNVAGPGSALIALSVMHVGMQGEGHLEVWDAGLVYSAPGVVGAYEGSQGTVLVSGLLSRWTNDRVMHIGEKGDATVVVEDQGWINSAAQIHVGFGSSDGSSTGTAELLISGAGQVTSYKGGSATTSGIIGSHADGVGTVTVSGPGSMWNMPDGGLRIGWLGRGTLNIDDGGLIACVDAHVGRMAGSVGEVTLSRESSTWYVSGDVSVGGSHEEAGGSGQINVNGTDCFVRIGYGEGGGVLRVWPDGSVNLNGGRVVVGGDVFYEPGSLRICDPGTVELRGGTIATEKTYVEGALIGEGTLVASGDVHVTGLVSPGLTPGTLSVDGNLVMGDGSEYVCEQDSLTSDLISVSGRVDLSAGSTLGVEVLEDLAALGEITRPIIETAAKDAIHGDFATKPSAGDYLSYGVFYKRDAKTALAYEVTVFQALSGDTEGDGDVDPTDLSKLVQNWAPAGTDKVWREGNFNDHEDGDVDPSDLSALVLGWSPAGYLPEAAPGGIAGPTAVPEPGTLLLLATGGMGLFVLWLRRSRRV